jgi:DNA-binding transcriptional MerR regulator
MKRPKTHPKTWRTIAPLGFADDADPADPDTGGGSGGDKGDDEPDKKPAKTFTQAEVNKFAAREKAEGKRAAEKALAEQLGVPLDKAKEIIAAAQKAEDEKKSEAEKERDKAVEERKAAEAEKREAAAEKHEARIERALAAEGFAGDDKKLGRVRKMITVEVGATYEDVLADVKDAKTEFPEIFAGKADDGDKDKADRKLPGSDPKGKPAKPNGGEDKFDAGAKRFEAQKAKGRGFNPLEKQKTT